MPNLLIPTKDKSHGIMPGAGDIHSESSRRQTTGYLPIEDYGLIGNMHTCALVSVDGSVDFMCW